MVLSDAEFMAALSGRESEPTAEPLATVTAAYDAVLAAWRRATAEHLHEEEVPK